MKTFDSVLAGSSARLSDSQRAEMFDALHIEAGHIRATGQKEAAAQMARAALARFCN